MHPLIPRRTAFPTAPKPALSTQHLFWIRPKGRGTAVNRYLREEVLPLHSLSLTAPATLSQGLRPRQLPGAVSSVVSNLLNIHGNVPPFQQTHDRRCVVFLREGGRGLWAQTDHRADRCGWGVGGGLRRRPRPATSAGAAASSAGPVIGSAWGCAGVCRNQDEGIRRERCCQRRRGPLPVGASTHLFPIRGWEGGEGCSGPPGGLRSSLAKPASAGPLWSWVRCLLSNPQTEKSPVEVRDSSSRPTLLDFTRRDGSLPSRVPRWPAPSTQAHGAVTAWLDASRSGCRLDSRKSWAENLGRSRIFFHGLGTTFAFYKNILCYI